MNEPLMAKSGDSSEPARTLVGHTAMVLTAVDALFGTHEVPTRLGRSWLRFFGLTDSDFNRFRRHLRVAAAAHDWGKANDGFQGIVTSASGIQQIIRHEILTGLLLADAEPLTWLRETGLDAYVILSAILSHHLKAGKEQVERPITIPNDGVVRLCHDHRDFETVRDGIAREAEASRPPAFCLPVRAKKKEINSRGLALRELLEHLERSSGSADGSGRLLRAVRSALIVADAVGSSVVRMTDEKSSDSESRLTSWIEGCFSTTLSGNDVWVNITKRRIADLRKEHRWRDDEGYAFGDERGFTKFQCEIADLGPRVLLTAACGSGKTLAAWNWIKAQLDREPVTRSRVLFLYPTRATATEGFRDYVSWAPEDTAGLLSGTADYELTDMFQVPGENDQDPRARYNYKADSRLFALGHWKKRVFSATADQFFPFLTYSYGPTCLLPLLAEAVVVVDEVHSFDRSMFAILKRFLKEFPSVPVLCMTATLPEGRRDDLTDQSRLGAGVLTPYPKTPPPDLAAISRTERYIVEWIERDAATKLARDELAASKRVLWVSNRVADCQQTFKTFANDSDLDLDEESIHCYHARFTLDDRKKHHHYLIQEFQNAVKEGAPARPLLGVTTQVCEMSLDLDTEILVTELAPISSLIQRMGRCNRDSSQLKNRPLGRVYVLKPEAGKEKPYEKDDLDAAKDFVERIAGGPISQDNLEQAFRDCDTNPIEPSKLCPFLDNGPFAEAGESWRDGEEFTVPCILHYHAPKVRKILRARNPSERVIDGYIVPVPVWIKKEKQPDDPKFPRWLSIVSGMSYCKFAGFDDRPFRKSGDHEQ